MQIQTRTEGRQFHKERVLERLRTELMTKIGIGGFDDPTKSKQFVRLCNDLNIELHDGAASDLPLAIENQFSRNFSSV